VLKQLALYPGKIKLIKTRQIQPIENQTSYAECEVFRPDRPLRRKDVRAIISETAKTGERQGLA